MRKGDKSIQAEEEPVFTREDGYRLVVRMMRRYIARKERNLDRMLKRPSSITYSTARLRR
ncbi:MAG: hypothetical protein ACYDCO_20730 [Armatimonadota bacterium]